MRLENSARLIPYVVGAHMPAAFSDFRLDVKLGCIIERCVVDSLRLVAKKGIAKRHC
jgi:hypothetical protein